MNDDFRDKWIAAFFALLLAGGVVAIFSGCASVNQHVTTMDGDTFEQRGFAFLSKQDIAQRSSAEFFPNNSGAVIGLNTDSAQDSTQAIDTINALIALGKAFAIPGVFAPAQPAQQPAAQPEPSMIGRAANMLDEIARLRAQVQALTQSNGLTVNGQ